MCVCVCVYIYISLSLSIYIYNIYICMYRYVMRNDANSNPSPGIMRIPTAQTKRTPGVNPRINTSTSCRCGMLQLVTRHPE